MRAIYFNILSVFQHFSCFFAAQPERIKSLLIADLHIVKNVQCYCSDLLIGSILLICRHFHLDLYSGIEIFNLRCWEIKIQLNNLSLKPYAAFKWPFPLCPKSVLQDADHLFSRKIFFFFFACGWTELVADCQQCWT